MQRGLLRARRDQSAVCLSWVVITCSRVYSTCTVLARSALCVRLLLFGLFCRLLQYAARAPTGTRSNFKHAWCASMYICAYCATSLQGVRLCGSLWKRIQDATVRAPTHVVNVRQAPERAEPFTLNTVLSHDPQVMFAARRFCRCAPLAKHTRNHRCLNRRGSMH